MPLPITIQPNDLWDEANCRFITVDKPVKIVLEHSLVSISKWEARWKKAYLSKEEKTVEEKLDYIRCMTLTQNVNPEVYYLLDDKNLSEINTYIEDPMTATTFNDALTATNTYKNKIVTSEEIYYLMFMNNIPPDFAKWHLNRLLTLLKVFSIKNAPPKKMSKRDTMASYSELNKARRAKYHTKG